MTTPDVSCAALLRRRAERTPRRRALTFQGTTWTFAELDRRVAAVAGELERRGVRRGDRVAYLGFNHPAFLLAMHACARLGAIFVPLNFRLTRPELEFIIGDAGVSTLISGEEHRDVVPFDLAAESLLQVRGGGVDAADAAQAPEPDDTAIIMYTSGTTGRPKGAMLTHSGLWWANYNHGHAFDVRPEDVTLTVMPIFHIGGLNVLTMITLQRGGEVVLHRSFDPGGTLADWAQYGVTTMMAVPAQYQAIVDHPDFAAADTRTVRTLICGGAPCPVPLLERYQAQGMEVHQGYGLTECSPSVCFLPPELAREKIGASGLPLMFVDVKLVDAVGAEVTEPHAKGEICVRGPTVMKGYWNRPQATAETIVDGWLHTGDVAYRDEDGVIYIADRVKDMIISGGENVYPAEVESVLAGHPAIVEVAVIGVPDERWGETPLAVAVLREGAALQIADLREFAGASLARYKLPTRLELVDVLPRTASGKVVKHELRAGRLPPAEARAR
ncbi:MAG TPA: long-chain fatty acid--CoA ligase [Solirubrobacteraceae bacterium]|nr:long-chain fatty acid--CoA ligase [Solirubrobacteraceae bacterium]